MDLDESDPKHPKDAEAAASCHVEPLDRARLSRPARFSLHPLAVSSAMSIIPVSPRSGLFGRVF
ncbi:hypothetical protein ACFSQT_15860 [Mesorhizobium calcicola]|uniref:Uncharacterized protein n=1 Tax=Mesorhizobium calcicola TaxID=1300310 RepID=A0ABW4WE77_9HYPH